MNDALVVTNQNAIDAWKARMFLQETTCLQPLNESSNPPCMAAPLPKRCDQTVHSTRPERCREQTSPHAAVFRIQVQVWPQCH